MKFERIKGNANHHLFLRGQRLWVRYSNVKFGTLERSLKTRALGLARLRRDQEIAKFTGDELKANSKVLLVDDKFPKFVELKRIKAPNTYKSIELHWRKHLQPYFGVMRLEDVTEAEWASYVQEKRFHSPGRRFFNDRKYLSMFLGWLQRDGLIKRVPTLEDVDEKRRAGKVFLSSEIDHLLLIANPDLKLQIQMAYTMGMRRGEIFSLEWSQIDFKARTIHLPAAKTKVRKARTFHASKVCLAELAARHKTSASKWVFPAHRGADGHLTPNGNQKAWRALKRKAGIYGRFHDLRHTFLTRAFKQPVNPALICAYAGLSMQVAEKVYLHLNHEDTKAVATLVNFEESKDAE